jgi:DNA repair protein RadA/Sms
MTRTQTTYRCAECGWTSIKWVGRCGRCEAWGTVTEDATASARTVTARSGPLPPARVAQPITRYSGETAATHRPTGIGEFDRVLGGGFVPGAAVLLSGEPGVGKSTLLLEVASRAAASGARVL